MHAYDCAWNEKEDPEYIKRMYFLTKMQPGIEIKGRFLELMSEEDKAQWDQVVEKAAAESAGEKPVVRIGQIFEKDPVRRLSGASEILNQWKLEYRNMI
jgi:hypothetical protein